MAFLDSRSIYSIPRALPREHRVDLLTSAESHLTYFVDWCDDAPRQSRRRPGKTKRDVVLVIRAEQASAGFAHQHGITHWACLGE